MKELIKGLKDKMPCSKRNPCEKCGAGQMWSEQYKYPAENTDEPPISYKCDKCGYEKFYENNDDPNNPTWYYDTEEEIDRIINGGIDMSTFAEPTITGLTYTIREMDKEFGDEAIPYIIQLLKAAIIHCIFWSKSIPKNEHENYLNGLNNLLDVFNSKLNKDSDDKC